MCRFVGTPPPQTAGFPFGFPVTPLNLGYQLKDEPLGDTITAPGMFVFSVLFMLRWLRKTQQRWAHVDWNTLFWLIVMGCLAGGWVGVGGWGV